MQTDELRRELTALADGIDPFDHDLRSLHHRRRRRRVLSVAVAVVVLGAGGATAIAIGSHDDAARVNVDSTPTKERANAQTTHFDAIVVPASEQVRAALERSPLVASYTPIGRGYREALPPPHSLLELPASLRASTCALERSDGFAVTASHTAAGFAASLAAAVGPQVRVFDVAEWLGYDLEVFMRVKASPAEVGAVRAALTHDPHVQSFSFLSQQDAYAVFVKAFADQPSLVASTKPSDLPESFRVRLASPSPGAEPLADRYHALAGVDVVITRKATEYLPPAPTGTSSCGPKG